MNRSNVIPFSTECEWTVSTNPHRMCGKEPLSKKSYCEEHQKRAYISIEKEEDVDKYLGEHIKGLSDIELDQDTF